uniref:SH3 domain containing ring finger 2 n=1 Tax=Neogobius melanostomus TaxID=47308 RepID=A0A8C6WFY8_9GOBI
MLDYFVSDERAVPERVGPFTMEELSLKALLECPLCSELLDTSAKVLPCKHTFCKSCLQRQETAHSQLLCPECQTPALAGTAEELPTNLLLVRLLEGLQVTEGHTRNSLMSHYDVPSSYSQPKMEENEGQQQDSYNYRGKQGHSEVRSLPNQHGSVVDDSVFTSGVPQKSMADVDSSYGNPNDNRRVYSSAFSSQMPLYRALCDFSPQQMNLQDNQFCLGFNKWDILTFIRRVDENWIEARLGTKAGICPLQFLEPNLVAAKLLEEKGRKGSDSAELQYWTSSGGKSKATDASSRTTHLGPSQVPGQAPVINSLPHSNYRKQQGASRNNFYTSKGEGTDISSFNHKGHHQRRSVPPAARSHSHPTRDNSQRLRRHSENSHKHLPQSEKRMSKEAPPTLTLMNPQMSSADSTNASTQQLSISVCAVLYSYKPRRPEELELRRGEMVGVYGMFKEGWLRGLSLRTGKVGILPSNYITPVLRTSARLFETKAANASSPYNSVTGRKPTTARNPAVVLALDKVNADGTMHTTGHVPSVPNGAQQAMPSSMVGKTISHGGNQGWDTVRRIFNPNKGVTQFNQMFNTNVPSNTKHFAQVQASGYSPALQRKKNSNILANCVRPFGLMSEAIAPSAAYHRGRDFTPGLSTYQPPPNAPQSILIRPESLKNLGEKPAKSVRFVTDEDSPPLRRRTSSWSAGQVGSSNQFGPSPPEVWAPSLTLGRDGPGIILNEGKAPIFRKGLETTISDLNSNTPVLSQPSFSAVSAQFSPTRHRVTKTHLSQTDSDLTLVQGEVVLVHRPRPDGRFLVTQESSGQTGLFQSNIVQVLERFS